MSKAKLQEKADAELTRFHKVILNLEEDIKGKELHLRALKKDLIEYHECYKGMVSMYNIFTEGA